MLLLLSCWQPGTYTPPQPENLPPLAQADAPDEAEVQEPEAPVGAEPEAPDEPEEPEAPDVPDEPKIDPYAARTLSAPLTLVDDVGQPVGVLPAPKMAVVVTAEEPPLRRKVRCDTCAPPVEGWVQWAMVGK